MPAHLVRTVDAAALERGAVGRVPQPDMVGSVRAHAVNREHGRLDGPLEEQVAKAVAVLVRRDALPDGGPRGSRSPPAASAAAPGDDGTGGGCRRRT